jgi:hypothetical protein
VVELRPPIQIGYGCRSKIEQAIADRREGTMGTADVTVHIDETIDKEGRSKIADAVRATKGVVAVMHHDEKPHLMIVKYDPAAVTSRQLLQLVLDRGVHAELIGL